jgi:hypothetical protein
MEDTMDTSLVIKKYIPSLALFIIGFIVGYKYMEQSLSMGLFCGWFLGGTVWGWYLTRTWFKPHVSTGHDSDSFFWVVGLGIRVIVTVAVGLVAMPIGIIQLIIALFVKGKQVSDAVSGAVNANQRQSTGSYNTPSTQSINQPVINTGDTWICKKCKEENPITSSTCKGCGEYK